MKNIFIFFALSFSLHAVKADALFQAQHHLMIASADHGIKEQDMEETIEAHQFYQANEVQVEFFVVDHQLLMVFLPMSESLFYCPGAIIKKLDHKTISTRFVRQSIRDNHIANAVQEGQTIALWKRKNPGNMQFDQSRLAKNPLAKFIVLPAETNEVFLYQHEKPIRHFVSNTQELKDRQ